MQFFIDFTKGFYTVSREALWLLTILQNFGCTDKAINLN